MCVECADAQTVTGSSRWPWKRGFWGQKADSSPPPAEVPASYSAVQPAASATAPASQPPSDEGNPNYDAVPDLLKLWSALAVGPCVRSLSPHSHIRTPNPSSTCIQMMH